MKRILTLLVAIILGIAAYSQSVSEYTKILQANGYTLCNPQYDNTTVSLEKFEAPSSYIVIIRKDADKITAVDIVAVLTKVGKYPFSDLEPVKLYPKFFDELQVVGDTFLSVEPYLPRVEIKGNTVQVAATYKPLAPVFKD